MTAPGGADPGPAFFRREPVTRVARDLLGMMLISTWSGRPRCGIIVETEAYSHTEKGCHAFGNRKTDRNRAMFSAGGVVYIYQCYGIHHLLNIVTGREGSADAVLIRALRPIDLNDLPEQDRTPSKARRYYSGPGRLTRTLGIHTRHNGTELGQEIRISSGIEIHDHEVATGPRIGIDYAGADAGLPWRFWVKDDFWVSRW